jgi:hypothetical protein
MPCIFVPFPFSAGAMDQGEQPALPWCMVCKHMGPGVETFTHQRFAPRRCARSRHDPSRRKSHVRQDGSRAPHQQGRHGRSFRRESGKIPSPAGDDVSCSPVGARNSHRYPEHGGLLRRFRRRAARTCDEVRRLESSQQRLRITAEARALGSCESLPSERCVRDSW